MHLKDVFVFGDRGAHWAAIAGRAIAALRGRKGGRRACAREGSRRSGDRSLYEPVVAPELVCFDRFPFLLAHAVLKVQEVFVDVE